MVGTNNSMEAARQVNILICDDDREIANAIAVYLNNEGYKTYLAHDGRQAIEALGGNEIHLIIMDIMMPGMDGFHATMEIRKAKNIPIIMLSAKSEYADKVLGLNAGADDYVTKPFNPLELIARVKSQLRRYTAFGGIQAAGVATGGIQPGGGMTGGMDMPENAGGGVQADGGLAGGVNGLDGRGAGQKTVFTVGGLEIDDMQKTVSVDGEAVKLTPIEYKILFLFMRNPGRVFSIDEIYGRVWGTESLGAGSTVTVHIRRIREKIEINPGEPKYIKVVWGVGYKIDAGGKR